MFKVVLKFGTGSLMSNKQNGKLNNNIFYHVANQVSEAKKEGVGIVIVSSGAIQAGKEALKDRPNFHSVIERLNKKELAGIGGRYLLNKWGEVFKTHGIETCQMLVTHANWSNCNERNNIRKGLLDCIELPVIPIVNENDPVSDEEIRWMQQGISENDKLARMISALIEADAILFLTDQGGVYDRNPEKEEAKLIREINGLERPNVSGKSKTGMGGIDTKIREGMLALEGGVKRAGISGIRLKEKTILKFIRGEKADTELTL